MKDKSTDIIINLATCGGDFAFDISIEKGMVYITQKNIIHKKSEGVGIPTTPQKEIVTFEVDDWEKLKNLIDGKIAALSPEKGIKGITLEIKK